VTWRDARLYDTRALRDVSSTKWSARPLQPASRMRTALLSLPSLLLVVSACATDAAIEEETESTETVDEALRSSVSCAERTETAYDSGRPYPISVITIGGKKVAKSTGHAFLKMQAAADAAGVYLALTSGFRTMAEQEYLYHCYKTGSCNGGNLAAPPGYSNHQNGLAVDVTTSSWLAANASRFGFVRTVPSEPWHYEYTGKDPGGPCGGESVSWISPQEGGHYTNGIWMKVKPKSTRARKVIYSSDGYVLGESSAAAQSFALRYSFTRLGWRTIVAHAFDADGRDEGESTVRIYVVP
jgi:hypothetical protein